MRQRITLMFCLLAALLLPNISAITQEDKLEVIASYSILADVVGNIGGDHIELSTLIPAGADPHTFQPSPRDLTPLAEADVIFVNGGGIEEALLEVIEGAAEDTPIVEASACVYIIPIGASGHAHDEHEDDGHADEHEDEHAHEDDGHAHDEHENEHEDAGHAHDEHEGEHGRGEMGSHCDEHDAEYAALAGDDHSDHDMHMEIADLSLFAGEWISAWAFPLAELQGSFDAMLAATPELTQDLISQYIEAINYTPFSRLTFDQDSIAFDGLACDYALSAKPVPEHLGDVALFETEDGACADARFMLLGAIHGTVEEGAYHFHMRMGASYEEVTDEQSLSFPSMWLPSLTGPQLDALYTGFARAIGMNIAAAYGVEIAMSDEEMAAMSGAESGDDDAHAEDDDHAHAEEGEHAHADEDEHAHEEEDSHAHADEDEHAHEEEDSHAHAEEGEHAHAEEDSHAHARSGALGRLEDIDCGGGHDHHADEHEHAHEEGGCDPHVWMNPHNIIYWSLMVRDVLSELDPDHADEYAAAAADYIEQLVALETEFILPLLEELPVDKRILITSHDSLGYLAHAYDFVIVSTVIPGGGTQVEPSARDVAALIDLVKEAGVAAIFGETTVSATVVEAIAADTGAGLAILYTGTLTEGEPAGTYLDYMRYNLRTIVEALGAGG